MDDNCILKKIPEIIDRGKEYAKSILEESLDNKLLLEEVIIPSKEDVGFLGGKVGKYEDKGWNNRLINGDNIDIIKHLLIGNEENSMPSLKGKIDLIYIDPPFLSNANYNAKISLPTGDKIKKIKKFAYSDTWEGGIESYLEMLYPRLYLMRELLSDRGSIYVHLDWHVVHYVKIIMDEIFGHENFINEIIWSYKSGGVSKKYFARKHDTILLYSKSENYIFNPQKEKSYNRGLRPYRFKNVEEFQDEVGWYTMVNMKDVWNIDMVGRTSKERVGYDTQKPKALLERMILCSTYDDSIVADFFAGSGTTGVAAEKLGRKWIMADIGRLSILTMKKRFIDEQFGQFVQGKIDYCNNYLNRISQLNVEVEDRYDAGDGKEVISILIKGYEIYDLTSIGVDEKYYFLIDDILKRNSFSLIDYLSVDPNFNGDIFMNRWQDYRVCTNNDKWHLLSNRIELKVDKKDDRRIIAIKAVDVFGIETFEMLEI